MKYDLHQPVRALAAPKLEYFPQRPAWHRRKKIRRIAIISFAVLIGLFLMKLSRSAFKSTSICGDCGELQYTTEWQIPFTSIVYRTSQSYSDSALSIVVKRNGLAPSQAHHWLYVGGTDGSSYATGDGSHVLCNIQAAYVADFLDCACKCGEKQFAQAWLKLILDPTSTKANEAHCAIPEIPKGGLSNQKEFDGWWNAQAQFSSQFVGQSVPHLGGS
jgi:RNA polymerase subunit RPABC4/transcription elongation factor Spt4